MCMTLEPYCQREKLLTMAYFPGEDRENEREKERARLPSSILRPSSPSLTRPPLWCPLTYTNTNILWLNICLSTTHPSFSPLPHTRTTKNSHPWTPAAAAASSLLLPNNPAPGIRATTSTTTSRKNNNSHNNNNNNNNNKEAIMLQPLLPVVP